MMRSLSWYYDRHRANKKLQVCTRDSKKKEKEKEKFDICHSRKRDVLSYLPDSVRVHILSSLPIRDAIKSKILSKRWRNTCYSLSKMEFSCNEFKRKSDFKEFVDNTLILHDGSDVQKFSVSLNLEDARVSPKELNAWITFAIQHNVVRFGLHLSSMPREFGSLPYCFFTCTTISKLQLSSCENIKWPTFTKFPMLKYLDLNGVTFSDESDTTRLFSSSACPLLQKLIIYFCIFKNIHTLSISFPSLKYLQLLTEDSVAVDLSLPVLLYIDYECVLPPRISCETLSAMSIACFQFTLPDSLSGELAFRDTAKKILIGTNNVETLNLSADIMEIFARDPDFLSYLPSSSPKLKHFYLYIKSTKSHVEVIACLLRTSPNLQTLGICIWEGDSPSTNIYYREGYWELNKLSIADNLKHLKSVYIGDLLGRESEMEIVRRLLESARVLETVTIMFDCISEEENYQENRMKSSEKLSSFRRVSPQATIIFSS